MNKLAFKLQSSRREQFDWILMLTWFGLVFSGLLMIYATTYHDTSSGEIWSFSSQFGRQLLWAGLSFVLLVIVYFIDWHLWESFALPLYNLGIVSLVALLFFGTTIKGATSWFSFGGLTIQPSELVKFTTALFVSRFLSPVHIRMREPKVQFACFALVALPAALIMIQPDPGSAVTFVSFFFLYYRKGLPSIYYILFISIFLAVVGSLILDYKLVIAIILLCWIAIMLGISRSRLFSTMLLTVLVLMTILASRYQVMNYALGVLGLVAMYNLFKDRRQRTLQTAFSMLLMISFLSIISYGSSYAFENILKPHQQDRINVWLQPEECDPRGSLYNLIQSKRAIGSGGLSGKGFLNGTMTKLNYVPEQTTDFIFSTIGEEQGFLGGAGIIILFTILIFRIIQIAERSRHAFIQNYCYSIAGFIFLHFFVNIGMTMGISPVIGIPLPFVSKGGSALMAFSIMIGVVLKMGRQR